MASNGVILLNLENRNAAEFQRLSVPDSYEKASGALTSGTYVTVYKWLYEGFMLAPSLCDVVDAEDHINLVDRTNGGVISVYPDDTITLEGATSEDDLIPLNIPANGVYFPPEGKRGFSSVKVDIHPFPQPSQVLELNANANGSWIAPFGYDGFNPVNVNVVIPPEEKNFKAYKLRTGSTESSYSIRVQKGHYVATEFSTNFDPDDMILDGDEIEVTVPMCTGIHTPYLLEGCVSIAYVGGWIIRATQNAHQYMFGLDEWFYFSAGTLLEQLDYDSSVNLFFCEDLGSVPPVHDTPVLSGTLSPDSVEGENEDLYVKYYEVAGADYIYGIDSIYRKVNGSWEPYTDPAVSVDATRILTTSTGGSDASVSIQKGVYANGVFTPTGEAVNVPYGSASSPITFDQLTLQYSTGSTRWTVTALVDVISTKDDHEYQPSQQIATWSYGTSVDFIVYATNV